MNKNIYIVIDVCENDKSYAYVRKMRACENLVSILNISGIRSANVCDTKKRACEIATAWNATYKENGTYMFDYPLF